MLLFRKFHAAGNDFIVLEEDPTLLTEEARRRLCNRHFGVGADGIIYVTEIPSLPPGPALSPSSSPADTVDAATFLFRYWNADGKLGSFCGNGARVAAWIAYQRHPFHSAYLEAADGRHTVELLHTTPPLLKVSLSLRKAPQKVGENHWFVDTGSPHFLQKVSAEELPLFPLSTYAPSLRKDTTYDPDGMNVSIFAQLDTHRWGLRTYERGVEAETLSCGTACAALAAVIPDLLGSEMEGTKLIQIETRGGQLSVQRDNLDLWLIGSVEETFRGEWIAPL
ncbi:MAG: diaminopimelate epimerase [Bacteroidia bacterium]|nr:diaminopimelate epimerase [Bacteroidia bacterium]